MASELKLNGYATGQTVYAVVENGPGQIANANTQALETYTPGNVQYYGAATFTEQASGTGRYRASFPTWITAPGKYNITLYQQLGSVPAISDNYIDSIDFVWMGSYEYDPSMGITIPGTGTTSGSSLTLNSRQLAVLNASIGEGGAGNTSPVASGSATVTYYLVGYPKTSGNIVAIDTPTYNSSTGITGRAFLIANPFPI